MEVFEIRNCVKAYRNKLDEITIENKSLSLIQNIYNYIKDYSGISDFLCYYPLQGEVNLLPLYKDLLDKNMHLYFPKTNHKTIAFFQ
ncbi:MAG: hypothetical protein K5675_09505, partial [Lachnospiraceae bacterium]|nr:hypothetical protein [Lachnospiraceae bacterium]